MQIKNGSILLRALMVADLIPAGLDWHQEPQSAFGSDR